MLFWVYKEELGVCFFMVWFIIMYVNKVVVLEFLWDVILNSIVGIELL